MCAYASLLFYITCKCLSDLIAHARAGVIIICFFPTLNKVFCIVLFFVWWCLKLYFQQYFSYIVAVSFIGGGNRRTRRKPLTCCKSLINFYHIRERPFNLKGGEGGYGFFLKKYSDSQWCWKKYSDFGGGKKNLTQSFCHIMLNSGEKKILTLVLSEKKFI